LSPSVRIASNVNTFFANYRQECIFNVQQTMILNRWIDLAEKTSLCRVVFAIFFQTMVVSGLGHM
jgi:hypothetical protein